MKRTTKFLQAAGIVLAILLLLSCGKEPVVAPEPPTPEPPPVDSCEDCGFGRLEGVPLLGYGAPTDRREEARAHIAAVQQKLRDLGWQHDYNIKNEVYSKHTVQEIALLYPDYIRLYVNGQRLGTTKNIYDFTMEESSLRAYDYLSDTVVIYIGGGPDYSDGTDHNMCLWQLVSKGLVDVGGYPVTGYEGSLQLPATHWLMDRAFNLPHTSIVEVPHATAGLFRIAASPYHWNYTIQFFDYTTACGNFQAAWPLNILSYEDAGLVNDIGVELLKRQGKTLAFHGSSWGAYVMTRYLLYYPIEDFERVVLAGFNPNTTKELLLVTRDNTNDYLETGKSQLGQEVYEMNRWRMLPWLTKHDLSRMRLLMGSEDDVVGFPTAEELRALTDAGATVVEQVGTKHSYVYYVPSPTDTAVRYTWEENMIVHTKSGSRVIRNPAPARATKAKPSTAPVEQRYGSNKWQVYTRK